MPAIYTHDSFGRAVVSTLPPAFIKLYEAYPEAFRLGFQGPDILFYHKPLKSNPIKKKGMSLHVDMAGGDFFTRQAQTLLQTTKTDVAQADGAQASDEPKNEASTKTARADNTQTGGNDLPCVEEILSANGAHAAYIAGFLCHFTLDVTCHPTIDSRDDGELTHGKIESELDKYVRRKDGVKLRGYNVAKDCIRGENGCAEAISKSLEVPIENIHTSIKTMRKINGFFTTSFAPFHGVAHFFLKIVGMERKFGDMFMHKKDDPRSIDLCPVLYEKMQNAIPRAAALIERYFNELSRFANEGAQYLDEIFRYAYNGVIFDEPIKSNKNKSNDNV